MSVLLASTAVRAAGFLPNVAVGDGIDITKVAVRPTDDPSRLRVSFVLENSGMQPARVNGLTVGGNASDIVVGGTPLDRSGPGLLVRYNETLDFSTSHLIATVQANEVRPEDLDHVVAEVEVDGVNSPIVVHRKN